MTNEELCALIQAGERDRLAELWEQVEKFVAMMAGRRARQLDGFGGVTKEDLYQSGFLAMVAAADSYDPSAGMAFIGWLSTALKTAFAEAIGRRTSKRNMLDYSLDLDAPVPGTDDLMISDSIPDPGGEAAFEDADHQMYLEQLHAALVNAMSALPAEQSTAIRGTFFDGLTLAVQAEQSGVSPERIRQRQAKGLRSLRHPRVMRELRPFVYPDADIYAAGLQRGHSTERTALRMVEGWRL